MLDSDRDTLVSVALSVDDVWVAADQGAYGVRLVTARPPSEVLPELIEAFHEQGWRTPTHANRGHEVSVKVLNMIDRAFDVYLTRRPHAGT
jgi:uncharacterized Fe-S radical SAM superfamily protein PflX